MAQGLKGSRRAAPDVLVKGRSCQEKRPSLLELKSVTKLKKARVLYRSVFFLLVYTESGPITRYVLYVSAYD